jgi:hypothetical protein
MNVFDVDDNNHITGLITKIRNLYREFLSLDVAERGAGTSFLDFIKYSIRSKASTDGLTLSMRAATFAAKALNLALSMAVGALIGMAINGVVSAIADYAQRIDTAATKTKEEADAANNATSSLKDLVNAYEELGDKSGWNTEDFDQAKDIQEELLALAKEQGTLDENKANQLDLQNGKYEEQLGLLKDITEEQLKASESKLIQSKDAQGNKLIKTAKDNNRSHFFSSVSANANLGIMNELKDAGIDVFNKSGNFGVKDLNDPDSIAKYYSELGKALDYIVQNTTEAQRAAGGAYHTVYQYLMDEQAALQDDADAYNDSTDAVNENVNARRKLQAIDFWSDGKSNGMDVSYSFDKVNSAIETLKNTIDDFDASKLNDFLWGKNDGLTDEQTQALAALRKALTDMDFSADTDGVNAFIQALVQVGLVAGSTAGSIDKVTQASQKMEDISSRIDEIQAAYKNATTAIEEYNKYGYLSADTLQTLLNEDFEYLSCLELVDGQLQVNTEKYQGMIAAQYQSAAMALVEKANAELAKIAQGEKKDAVEDATKATEDQATALTERVCPALGEFAKASMTAAAAQEFLANGDAAWSVDPERTKEVYAGLASGLDILDATVNQIMGNSDKFRQHMNGFDKETKNRNKNTAKSVTDVASAFDTLNKAMKEYNQYGYLCADTAKSLVGLDDKFTACLTKQGNKLQINVEQFRKFVKEQLKEANAAKDGGKSADEMNKILNYLDQNVDTTTISFEQLTDAIKGYGTAMDEAKEKTDAIKSAFSGLSGVLQTLSESQFGISDSDAVDKQADAVRELVTLYKDYPDLLNNIVDENGNINLNTEAFKKALADTLEKLATTAKETGGAGADALYNAYHTASVNISQDIISVNDYINGLGSDLSNANSVLDKYQTNWSTLKDVMDEWNSTGQLTQDSMQKLMELPDEFSSLLSYNENGDAKLDVKALRNNYVDKLKELAKEFKGKPIGIQAEAMIEDVREPTPEEYERLAKKTLTYQKALAKYTAKLAKIDSNKTLTEDEALQQKAEAQAELDGALQKSLLEVQETDAQVTAKLKKHWDGAKSVIENFKSALSDLKDVFSSLLSLFEKFNTNKDNDLKLWGEVMGDVIDKRIEALNKQKEALEKANDEEERAITLAKLKAELEKARTQRTVRKLTSNGYEWVADESAVKDAKDNLNDQQRQWRKEDAEKAIDDQIKKYNEFKDKLSEVMDDIGKSWKDYQKELEYTAQIQKMSLSDMEGSLDGYHNKIIASLNTGSAITSIQNLITNLESLINTLTKVNNLYSMFKTGEYKDLGTKGLWNTIKGFFNNGGKEATGESANVVENFFKVLKSKVQTSGNGLIETFGGIWEKIKGGAQSLFNGSGSGGGIISTFVNGFKAIGNAVSKSKIGSALVSGGGKLVAGATNLLTTAGSALAAAGPYAIPIAAAVGLGVYGGTKSLKHQKEIWSNKDDGFLKKAVKSVGSFFWDISPIGAIVNLCKDIAGKNKQIADNTKKDNKNNSSNSSGSSNSSSAGVVIGNIKGKKATGSKSIKQSGRYNVDESGPELLVRQPASGRYTYLETGDGVVPADITSRLFDMGGNPDRWFTEQLERHANVSNVQNRTVEGDKITIGDIYIQNPIGGVDDLAREINQRMPAMFKQIQSKR